VKIRIGISLIALLLIAAVSPALMPITAQDATSIRLSSLEARVEALEATVAAMSEWSSPAGERLDSPVITGEIRLVGKNGSAWTLDGSAVGCAGVGEYDHLMRNGEIRIGDETGSVIATAGIESTVLSGGVCLVTFQVEVPKADVYIVELSQDDTVAYTHADMESNDWEISITRRIS
jgi:hypothetical protein